MKNKDYRKIMDLLALLVFGAFALSVALVLLLGARVYQNLTERSERIEAHRVAARYLTTRFHQSPEVWVEDFGGVQALSSREEINGRAYLTRVYCYEGRIRELYSGEKAPVAPGDGEILLEAESVCFRRENDVLCVEIVHTDDEIQQLYLWLPSWKEVEP